jgi:hypothetical protein
MLKRIFLCFFSVLCIVNSGFSQGNGNVENKILFRGLVKDAYTFIPIKNSQITINGVPSLISGNNGNFAFYVGKNDTVIFKSLGYKPTIFHVTDTLKGSEFITGVYLSSDTILIGEVIILPKFTNLKSDILNAKSKTPANFDNARYNVAISAYQGKINQGSLGNPADNYAYLNQQQKVSAYEKGGIPSDKMIGFNSLLFLPAAYMLIKGLPEVPPPYSPELTDKEVIQIQQRYIETLKKRK